MLALKKIAITGPLASGKSTVLSFLKKRGAYVVNCDHILHTALDHNDFLKHSLIQILGTSILDGGSILRKRVADIIFSNNELLDAVEKVTHQYLFEELKKEYIKAHDTGSYFAFVAEVPLLFESPHPELVPWFDIIVYVTASESTARKRWIEKGLQEKDFIRRNRRLLPEDDKKKRAHIIIDNSSSLMELEKSIENLLIFI